MTGVMRLNECEQVKETLEKHLGINLTVADGADLFLGRLKGVTEPEKKRKMSVCLRIRVDLSNTIAASAQPSLTFSRRRH